MKKRGVRLLLLFFCEDDFNSTDTNLGFLKHVILVLQQIHLKTCSSNFVESDYFKRRFWTFLHFTNFFTFKQCKWIIICRKRRLLLDFKLHVCHTAWFRENPSNLNHIKYFILKTKKGFCIESNLTLPDPCMSES